MFATSILNLAAQIAQDGFSWWEDRGVLKAITEALDPGGAFSLEARRNFVSAALDVLAVQYNWDAKNQTEAMEKMLRDFMVRAIIR